MEHATFETERLILRPTDEADADFVFRLMNTPKWLQFIGDRKVRSVEDARTYIQNRMLPQLQRLGYSNYTITRKQDRLKIGSCGLYDREGVPGIDIGFAFLPAYENMGYGFEAASRLMRAAFHDYRLERLSAITSTDNRVSQKLLEKLGLTRNGTITLPGSHEALVLYQIERERWLSQNSW